MDQEAAVDTHCPYCAMQCGMTLEVDDNGGWRVLARDFPTNKGGLCRKGWTAAALLGSPERLSTPLLRRRKGDELRPATWDEALDFVADRTQSLQETFGRDAIALFGGGGLTNEKAYMLGKFARVGLKTKNIDYNGRFCMASSAIGNVRAFGLDRGLPFPMEDIAATAAVLLIGSNAAETLPPIMQYFDAQRANGGELIVVDPRRTATAKLATLHLQVTPSTDGALANGLMNVAIRDGLIDTDFIAERTTGFEAVRRAVASFWPDRVERMTGVPAKQIERAAHILGEAATAITLSGRGPEQQTQGVDNVLAFINLTLALGHSGKPLCGYGCLTGQGNGQGGREHGQKAEQLPGYRSIANPTHRSEIAAVWGIDATDLPGPGLPATELIDAFGDGGIHGLLVFGANLAVSAPNVEHTRRRLAALDLLVVADPFLSDTAALADVVLPATQWAEEDGTMTNLEGRVVRRRRAIAPPPGVRSDLQVLKGLADRLGAGAHFTEEPEAVFAELRAASANGTADYAGISYARIEDGVFWPCPNTDGPGTPRLFLERYATPDGRARFHAVRPRVAAEEPDDEYPYFLTTGRILTQYQSGAQTRRVAELRDLEPDVFAEIHPATARSFGVDEGGWVRLTTRRGTIVAKARLTRDIRLDTLFVPFHWGGESSVNVLTNAAVDPVSHIPEFKTCAVRLERCQGPDPHPAKLTSASSTALQP